MEWKKINRFKLPEGEVLAANFNAGTFGYKEKIIGYMTRQEDSTVQCESEHEVLENCSHYIEINKFDIQQ